jgi:hypothetical protein
LAYGDNAQVWTGPVLESCTVTGDAIVLKFNQEKMLDDTLQVLQPTVHAIDLTRHPMGNSDWTTDQLSLLQTLLSGGGSTPMEVQLNGKTTGEMSDGIWLPVSLQDKCSNTPNRDKMAPGQGGCSWNYTTGTKLTVSKHFKLALCKRLKLEIPSRYFWFTGVICVVPIRAGMRCTFRCQASAAS